MTAGFGARFVMALAELLGKRVRAFAGEAGGAVRVSGCLASAAGLHPFELPSAAGGLPLVRAGLHLAIRHGAVKRHLVCKRWTIEKADENSNDTPWFALHRPNSDKLRF